MVRFDGCIVRGEYFSYAKMLVETNLMSSISESIVIVCENLHFEVVAHKITICPSIPCSLVSSLVATMMVDFPAGDVGSGSRSCKSLMAMQEGQQPPYMQGCIGVASQRHYGTFPDDSSMGWYEAIIRNDFPMINGPPK